MTNEVLRDRELFDLICRVEGAQDEVQAILGLDNPDLSDLCDLVDRVDAALGEAADYLLQLRDERLCARVSA